MIPDDVVPVLIRADGDNLAVDWCWLGDLPFEHPFFHETVTQALRHPYARLTWRTTSLETLLAFDDDCSLLPLSGVIFHVSRCGSTLISQMLAANPAHVVLSEPDPVENLLRFHRSGRLSFEAAARCLRALIRVLGRPRRRGQTRIFLKADCWRIGALPLIRTAFPGVPWIFNYREPVEVLVSHMRTPAAWLIPGALNGELANIPLEEAVRMGREEYAARNLEEILRLGLAATRNDGLLVNYSELPDAFVSRILPHFGVDPAPTSLERYARVALRDAKTRGQPFHPDSSAKRAEAGELLHAVCAHRLDPLFAELEQRRALSFR